LIAETGEILNLSNFDLGRMSLRVYKLELEKGKLTLQAEADVHKIPTAESEDVKEWKLQNEIRHHFPMSHQLLKATIESI
jgi:hypothetical protein